MIAVALVGLNLAGGIATANLHRGWVDHSRGWSWWRWDEGSRTWSDIESKEGRGLKRGWSAPEENEYIFAYNNQTIEIGLGYGTPRQVIKRIVLAPSTPTTLQICSPLIASVLLTILVLVVPQTRSGLQRCGAVPVGDLQSTVRPRLVGRRLMIVSALVGLNLVAARHRRAPDPYDDRMETPIRSTADLLVKPDGAIVPRPVGGYFLVVKPDGFHGLKNFGGKLKSYADGTIVAYDEHGVRVSYEYDHGRTLGTIVYRPDGSIVGYEGRPGEMQGPSHVIRPPLRSFLEMWWPVVASASITLLALCWSAGLALQRLGRLATQFSWADWSP